MTEQLFKEERLMRIMDKIHADGKVVVTDLADEFALSKPSIRSDLAELESRGLIERTHGGAILKDVINNRYIAVKNDLELRKKIYKEEKQRIGQAVINLIHDGDSIMIDGGSSTYYVVKNIGVRRGLTIITSTLSLLPLMLEIPDAKVYLTGGLLHKEFEDLIGEISVRTLRRFKPNYAIFGIDAISMEDGLFSTESSTAEIKKQMILSGAQSIVVADSSKFGNVSLCHVADLEDVDYLVTDKNISQEYIDHLKDTRVRLIVV
jgi:DeoR/GlpR family transcriptional regulator of sugar metabolism